MAELETPSPTEERIKELSNKVKTASEERDAEIQRGKEKDERIASLEKENAFNTGFVEILSSHSNAKEHKDAIKEKVFAGYSIEDATFAVLGKAGLLNTPVATPPNPAGGSAATQIPQSSSKNPSEMSQEERRKVLSENLGWS